MPLPFPVPPLEDEIEIWKSIPGYSNYEASSFGRIRSLDCYVPFVCRWGHVIQRFNKGRIIKLLTQWRKYGGLYLLFHPGKNQSEYVNRCVCSAFNGPPPSREHQAAHIDGNALNNRPSNLVWATPLENTSHKNFHGTMPIGEKNPRSILTEKNVKEIVGRYLKGDGARTLSIEYGVSLSAVNAILQRINWVHVQIDDLSLVARRRENAKISWKNLDQFRNLQNLSR